jgi:SpoVK/Ycf46/Vps4 family AAA+-type ATPase
VKHSKGFTGAEIEAAIISAMYEAFSDNERKITSVDIVKELKESVPIYITMKEKIEELRIWAAKRARNASKFKNVVIVKQFQAEDRNNDLN